MKHKNAAQKPHPETDKQYHLAKKLIFISEISLILALLAIWIFTDTIKKSSSLIVLFFYSFPAEFLVGLVPHEPVLLYYGEFYSPFTVAIVSVIGTVLAEALNYSVFKFVADTNILIKLIESRNVQLLVKLFNKSPFLSILVAGFSPVPFYPFRFLVVIGHYPVAKYLLAVFLSRAPRFYILAQIGYIFKIPVSAIIVLFIILICFNIPLLRNLKKKSANSTNQG